MLENAQVEVRVACKDRTFYKLTRDCPSSREVYEEVEKNPSSVQTIVSRHFVMELLVQLLTCLDPKTTKLVIAYDGALCLIPWLLNRVGFALFHLLQVIN